MCEIDRRAVLQKQRKREQKLVGLSTKPEGEDQNDDISDDDDFFRGGLEEKVQLKWIMEKWKQKLKWISFICDVVSFLTCLFFSEMHEMKHVFK